MSNDEIFSEDDKDYLTITIDKIENETNFDYYETDCETKKNMIMNYKLYSISP